jgi:hypothetical protein
MENQSTAVFGKFETRGEVESAINSLQAAGFAKADLSLMFPENASGGAPVEKIAGVEDVGTYGGAMKDPGILLAVQCVGDEKVRQARESLERAGGQSFGEAPGPKASGAGPAR